VIAGQPADLPVEVGIHDAAPGRVDAKARFVEHARNSTADAAACARYQRDGSVLCHFHHDRNYDIPIDDISLDGIDRNKHERPYLDKSQEPTEAAFALEAAVWIMVALADEPKHGYAIMKDIQKLGGFSMAPGTLYAALARMDRAGLVEEVQTEDYRQRPFRLTALGRARLTGDLQLLAALTSTGSRRLKRKSRQKGPKS